MAKARGEMNELPKPHFSNLSRRIPPNNRIRKSPSCFIDLFVGVVRIPHSQKLSQQTHRELTPMHMRKKGHVSALYITGHYRTLYGYIRSSLFSCAADLVLVSCSDGGRKRTSALLAHRIIHPTTSARHVAQQVCLGVLTGACTGHALAV